MLRRVILGFVLLLVAGVVLIGAVFTVSVVASGCRLFSVDEREFVAANRAILDELPVFPGAARVFSSSNGWPASNRCFAFENGPPYDRFLTSDRLTLPSEGEVMAAAPWTAYDPYSKVPAVTLFYDRELTGRGWRLSHYSGPQVWYRKGEALLGVSSYVESHRYELSVVHDAK